MIWGALPCKLDNSLQHNYLTTIAVTRFLTAFAVFGDNIIL
jgi:hypothetical protein